MTTEFAPAERATRETLHLERRTLLGSGSFLSLETIPHIFMVLNGQRQVIHANKALLDLLQIDDVEAIVGQRPGEVLSCLYAHTGGNGCGTSEHCQACGAVIAALSSLKGTESTHECRLLRSNGNGLEAMDLRVTAAPLTLEGRPYSLVTMADISHEKRRRIMERTFFHDLLNRAGGLGGIINLLADRASGELSDDLKMVAEQFTLMVDEIIAHRDLLQAENHEIDTKIVPLSTSECISQAAATYTRHEAAQKRSIRVLKPLRDYQFYSDRRLLGRVLGNMLKNALEATPSGGVVTISSHVQPDSVLFSVRNPGYMDRPVQLEIFKRSFTTKGPGRGLGTYSIKLITERYLGGSVGFFSSPESGTEFWVRLPRPKEEVYNPRCDCLECLTKTCESTCTEQCTE